MSADERVLIELGVDYLTATAKDKMQAEKLHYQGSMLFRVQRDFGNKPAPWGMKGFTGFKCGSVQVATLDQAVMVRLSSDSAARSWRQVAREAENVSRIDLQATVRYPGNVTREIDKLKRKAIRESNRTRHKRVVRWLQEHHGGYTLYLGDRKSNVFGRVYDKYQASKEEAHLSCVRFEAQFQKRLARFIARDLVHTDRQRTRIASYITQFFEGRGVSPELPYVDAATYCCSRPRSDADKNLAWLRAAVRPSVLRLIDLGRGNEVLEALGLVDNNGPGPSMDHNN